MALQLTKIKTYLRTIKFKNMKEKRKKKKEKEDEIKSFKYNIGQTSNEKGNLRVRVYLNYFFSSSLPPHHIISNNEYIYLSFVRFKELLSFSICITIRACAIYRGRGNIEKGIKP